MINFNRKKPYYNIKHINEISAWTIAGFSYFSHKEPTEIKISGNERIQKFALIGKNTIDKK